MPTMAALSVKKADETTNITYDVLTPSPGDGGVAVWRQDTGAAAGMPVGQRATLTVGAGFNGPRTARRLTLTFKRPYSYIDANGKYVSQDQVVLSGSIVVPQNMPPAEIAEAVHQGLNLFATTLIKDACKTGYSPA